METVAARPVKGPPAVRGLLLGFLAVGWCVFPIARAAAAPQPLPVLTLSGSHDSTVSLSLNATTSWPSASQVRLRFAGAYAGYLLETTSGQPVRGAIEIKPLDTPSYAAPMNLWAGPSQIAPGAYRLLLLADGAASVAIPVRGLRADEAMTATRALRVYARTVTFPPIAPSPAGYESLPIDVAPTSFVAVAESSEAEAGQATYVDPCVTGSANSTCEWAGYTGDTFLSPGCVLCFSGELMLRPYAPGELGSGLRKAIFEYATGGLADHHAGFVLVIGG